MWWINYSSYLDNTRWTKIDIDFEKEFALYNPIFADRINAKNDLIEIIKDDKIIHTYDQGIILGVGAGDITYQLRGK